MIIEKKCKAYINEKLEYKGEYLFDRLCNGKGYDNDNNIIKKINYFSD